MEHDDATARLRVGTTLGGKYELLRVIGSGGMGAVYEARNAWTGRRVAIKVLHPESAARPEVLSRFIQEAQVATRVVHPNVVEVLDLARGGSDGAYYIVQELIEGRDLRALMDEAGSLSPRRAVELMAPVMRALSAAHRAGVVHRDVKPENVLVARDASGAVVPKVIDFGVSKLTDAERPDPGRTLAGTTLGTPHYMSPEQCRGEADLDGRSDVWAVGAVLYEMLSGEPPFDAPSYNALIIKVCTQRPEPLGARAPSLPPELVAVVHRALAADRAERYPSMEALLDALQACPLDGDSLPPAAPGAEPARVATPMHWTATPAPSPPRRRSPWTALAGAAVMVCATAFALVPRRGTAHASRPTAAVVAAPPAMEPVAPAVVVAVEAPAPRVVVAPAVARVAPRPAPRVGPRPAPRAPGTVVGRSSNGALILAP